MAELPWSSAIVELTETIAAARNRLPFPDPMLTFGEVVLR